MTIVRSESPPMLVPVILSGGAGTRLWPVSRRSYPKPFMRMADGESLLHKTVQRALRVASHGAEILTVTGKDYLFVTRSEFERTAMLDSKRMRLLIEPVGRNTAPAVIAAALDISARHGRDAVLLVLPADHLIRDLDAFSTAVSAALRLAADENLVTFGVLPTRPDTGFGYIARGASLGADGFAIERFVEKPDAARAEQYLLSGNYYWNSGMFAFRAGSLLDAAALTCPDVLDATRAAFEACVNAENLIVLDAGRFAAVRDISIDYAIMEHATRRAVVPAHFDWSDIGSWTAVAEQSEVDADGNRSTGDAVLIESRDCFVRSESRTIAAVGVAGLTIIETSDALLVVGNDSAQQVKQVVDQLRARGSSVADTHATVHRPWGSYTVLEDADDCKVKRLVVKPGQVLSLQLHHQRSEHWTVVRGTAKVRVGEEEKLLRQNESVYIPMGTVHRLENPTDQDIALIEVQCGDYFGEDDIVRLEDRYGRVLG